MNTLTSYTLDLDDKIKFIALSHTPILPPEPGESWVWIFDVTELGYRGRTEPVPSYTLVDASNTPTMVSFPTHSRADIEKVGIQVGKTLVLKNAMVSEFYDRRIGFVVKDFGTVETIPVPVKRIRELNRLLRSSNDSGRIMSCSSCGKPSKTGCARCSSRYCSRECQTSHWMTHKKDCRALKKLHEWNETNWG
ncbi:hypothetical protein BDY24DRAFT_389657 [Mrakia frigida]|uniref:zinc finger MYND domain-containing protein n=1 Tax=Mrakia frigida TaxID=29902 RepID=UPI003FCBF897